MSAANVERRSSGTLKRQVGVGRLAFGVVLLLGSVVLLDRADGSGEGHEAPFVLNLAKARAATGGELRTARVHHRVVGGSAQHLGQVYLSVFPTRLRSDEHHHFGVVLEGNAADLAERLLLRRQNALAARCAEVFSRGDPRDRPAVDDRPWPARSGERPAHSSPSFGPYFSSRSTYN